MLNVLAMAGFMTFWAKCNTRSVPAAGPEAAAADGKRPRSNGTAQQGPSISHEVLLKRLSSLEDVVYRQLNGTRGCFRSRTLKSADAECCFFFFFLLLLHWNFNP